MQETLRRILTARVYDVAIETPLDPLPRLAARLGRPVLQKREDLQPIFSFKIRGAYNKIATLTPEQLARVFERFFRVEKGRSRETGGTGLGLSIVKHIVQLHGGRVWAENREGSGLAILIRLPRVQKV